MEIYNDTYCVYMHTNKTNGKVYIGYTKHGDDPNERWDYGRSYKPQNPVFWNAIEKYTWDGFYHDIAASNLTFEEAENFEILLIAEFKANCKRYRNPSFGYNLTDGGRGTKGHKLSEEAKAKIGEASKKLWNTPGHREKMIEKHTGIKRQPWTQEQKDRMSKKLTGLLVGEKNPMCRAVYCPDLDEEFYSAHKAHEVTGAPTNGISCCCNGTQKTAGKHPITGEPLHWEYVDKSYIEKNKHLSGLHAKGTDWWNIRPTNQYSLDGQLIKRWDLIAQAGEELDIDPSSIRKACAGIYVTAGGFLWRYRDEYDEEYFYVELPKKKVEPMVKLDLNDNFIEEYFGGAPEINRLYGFDTSSLHKCCNGKMKSYKGFHWKRSKDYYEMLTIQNDLKNINE